MLDHHEDMVVLAFCTHIGCAMTKISRFYGSSSNFFLKLFFDNKDITFVGVHIKDDIKRLEKCFGLQIRNAVDITELAADVLHQPRLRAFGVRKLASKVLLVSFQARSSSMDQDDCTRNRNMQIIEDRIECATIDAYAAYKTGKKLLGV
ncbi:hypothetical protein CCACVL1_10768 [Corchorus capsularis]|uniref:3'-5' exonuclease domain-containing protein n=1 Tax=Corchorus capsularis TaxID=210143 RepID=A0A1R3IPP3_COCAP|nr:hypothetical protein CCACVL1_10768 [Corchorus capsularis]